MTSNAHRANETIWKTNNIRDDLEEVVTLSALTVMVAEWVPFGSNQMVQLNSKLGSAERVQGGYLTTNADAEDVVSVLEVPTGLTRVRLLDHDSTRFVNIEAEARAHRPPATAPHGRGVERARASRGGAAGGRCNTRRATRRRCRWRRSGCTRAATAACCTG